MPKLLLIGDTSAPEALGSKLLRGYTDLTVNKNWDIQVAYNSPAPLFSPSMKTKRGKIYYHLNDKRSWEWGNFQEELLQKIEEFEPDLTLVTGILPLKSTVFKQLKAKKFLIVNYLTDDPWNPIHRRNCFLKNIEYYDHIFSTKKLLQDKLQSHSAKSTSWLPFAYDPHLHYPSKGREDSDVVFVGTGDIERIPWLEAITSLKKIKRRTYGNSWEKIKIMGWEKRKAVIGDDYCRVIHNSNVVLGLLRAANHDQSTDRSYEIGAIGGCGIYQDTQEHRELIQGYPDIGFFNSPSDLREKVQVILGSNELQQELRYLGSKSLRQWNHTYSARMETILTWAAR